MSSPAEAGRNKRDLNAAQSPGLPQSDHRIGGHPRAVRAFRAVRGALSDSVGSYPWASAFLTDVRQTVAPSRGAKDGLLPPLLVALTVVTGLVDAFSYLVLGHVFVANMTGNVVFFAFALAGVGAGHVGHEDVPEDQVAERVD